MNTLFGLEVGCPDLGRENLVHNSEALSTHIANLANY